MDIGTYIENLAERGRYHFTTDDAVKAVGSSPAAVRAAIRRVREKGRVAMPFRSFHVIVPPEYRSLGCLPAEQFVPQLMEHLGLVYYAGLLTAASLHGAAHHAPMVAQFVTAENRPGIHCGRVRVQFVARRNLAEIPTIRRNTNRGIIHVSALEATMFDLVGYPGHSGGLSNVMTILSECAGDMDVEKLAAEISHSPLPWTQRLGFLLENTNSPELSAPMAKYVSRYAKEYVPLRIGKNASSAQRDSRWKLLLNEAIELEI